MNKINVLNNKLEALDDLQMELLSSIEEVIKEKKNITLKVKGKKLSEDKVFQIVNVIFDDPYPAVITSEGEEIYVDTLCIDTLYDLGTEIVGTLKN